MYSTSNNKLLLHLLGLMVMSFAWGQPSQVIDSRIAKKDRTFTIDFNRDTFLMDGEPFRFIAGSFHYFRAHPETWQRKLRTMRAAGLNAVTTYVLWSLHNPKEGVYKWDGFGDLERFIQIAQQEDLYVILRPGPYICAEIDMGGFPYWLLTKHPGIKLRTSDIDYLHEVRTWYSHLMPKMVPHLYGNGGPIIMVQVENEYGSFSSCDGNYTAWLRDETHGYVKDKAVLFRNDGPDSRMLRCGHISGVLATLDFGSGVNTNNNWKKLKPYQPKGPLVNAEYYPGWLTHWQENMARTDTHRVVTTLIDMLKEGANVNFYMFHGGTNFGFYAGANNGGLGGYQADITSYDYDAPMDEAGDPTPKYLTLRQTIGQYFTLPNITVPNPVPKKAYGKVELALTSSLLSSRARHHLSTGIIKSKNPLTFEALDQFSGLVLYETELPNLKKDPSILRITKLNDRGYVYVDRSFIGVLSRENLVNSLPINAGSGHVLQILVENQGRINYGIANDFKGILSEVSLDKRILTNWNMTKFPLEDYEKIDDLINSQKDHIIVPSTKNLFRSGPAIFHGEFNVAEAADTYLDPTGWGKGIAFINGFNLGRYWPVVGPQITLYVPKELLKVGKNRLVLIEYQMAPEPTEVHFKNAPNLDG